MGGAMREGGNRTPSAEFNILVDPEAADIVFRCGRPITQMGLDVTHQVLSTRERVERIRALESCCRGDGRHAELSSTATTPKSTAQKVLRCTIPARSRGSSNRIFFRETVTFRRDAIRTDARPHGGRFLARHRSACERALGLCSGCRRLLRAANGSAGAVRTVN